MRLHRHHPAARELALGLEAHGARRLHPLEGVPPQKVQHLRLARQQVVADAEPLHRVEVRVDDARGDVVGERGGRVAARFDGVQRLDAQAQPLGVFLRVGVAAAVEEADARVQVPAVIVERVVVRRRRVERAHVFERQLLDVLEADDHVGDLHARVVDVVVHFDALAARAQDADERVAEHRVAHVADVRRLVRVDARVLDHPLRTLDSGAFIDARRGIGARRCETREQTAPLEEEVEVARARDLDARDLLGGFEVLLQLFGDGARVALLARRLLDALRHLERDGEREVAEFRARRHLHRHLFEFDAETADRARAHDVAQLVL